jgi:hypothetical protein
MCRAGSNFAIASICRNAVLRRLAGSRPTIVEKAREAGRYNTKDRFRRHRSGVTFKWIPTVVCVSYDSEFNQGCPPGWAHPINQQAEPS